MARANNRANEAPYAQIASDLRRRIRSGELRVGARVPSTRELTREWNVALATASKALTLLRQEGVIDAHPRVGYLVAGVVAAPSRTSRRQAEPDAELTRERIVQTAIAMTDAEGLSALSMRGVAAKLAAATMSLYRHVEHKDDLVRLMTDRAFGETPLPERPPVGWRARVALAARMQWRMYRKHPWLAQTLTLTRPLALPNVIAHADWMLNALSGLGLDAVTLLQAHMIVFSYVRGIAINLEAEAQAAAESGMSDAEWTDTQGHAFSALAATGRFPSFARVLGDLAGGYDLDLDAIFEFGLEPLLDGLASLIRRARR